MTPAEYATQIQLILKTKGGSLSSEVIILPSEQVSDLLKKNYKFILGVSATDAVEVDKVQSVMTMVSSAKFIKWVKDSAGDLLIYGVGS